MHTSFLFIGGLGGWEVFLIIAVVTLLFGAKKIPELARGLGSGIREFKNATNETLQEIQQDKRTESKGFPKAEQPAAEKAPQQKPVTENEPLRHTQV